jgi:hypothetical protein
MCKDCQCKTEHKYEDAVKDLISEMDRLKNLLEQKEIGMFTYWTAVNESLHKVKDMITEILSK